tara:strand:- start:977 stop:1318 length:342 start_codon:yes stop_codon:yes gene_type:complete
MKDSKYNGWTNHETWNFNLWITNEESDYNHALELAEDSENPYELSKKLKLWAEERAEDYKYIEQSTFSLLFSGFIMDMINASIKEVNFYEVAEHLWEDITQRTKERNELWGEE